MRTFSLLWCGLAVGVMSSAAAPLAMSNSGDAQLNTELLRMPAPTFFSVYTQQHAALDSAYSRPDGIVERLIWANDKHQLRSVLHDYAASQFNSRFDAVFAAVTKEMPRQSIFVRSARTRQRIASELARESELAYTKIHAWTKGRDIDPAFLPNLEQSVSQYRQYLASFTAKSVEWINQAAHKLH